MKPIKRIAKLTAHDLGEFYLLLLLIVGIPLIGFIYADFKLALALSVAIQSIIGILYLRKDK